jgi:hypothetical protein
VRTAEIIEFIESAMARIKRDAAPTQDAASHALEKQRRIFDDLERAIEDAVDDVHTRRKIIRHIDEANDAVWSLPQIIASDYAREDFRDLRVLPPHRPADGGTHGEGMDGRAGQ